MKRESGNKPVVAGKWPPRTIPCVAPCWPHSRSRLNGLKLHDKAGSKIAQIAGSPVSIKEWWSRRRLALSRGGVHGTSHSFTHVEWVAEKRDGSSR